MDHVPQTNSNSRPPAGQPSHYSCVSLLRKRFVSARSTVPGGANGVTLERAALPVCDLNASERLLPAMYPVHSMTRRNNSNRTSIVRCGRQAYGRLYPVLMVRPDGSTINIRYKEPKKMITMPVDVSLLPEAERKARMRKRDPKKAKMKEEEFEDEFKVNDYSKFWKKK
ncbi:large ribosomal subunit protein mL55 isoform X2 [Heptranchias perlo]|uniref:large ribosomal subunit protein mL55 isoform X2 n=1 Tax=Heptranchias perlo TaxID=212740 RepID=UPI00355AC276